MAKKNMDFLEEIEERFGLSVVNVDEETLNGKVRVIPTGSLSLDISTGVGGIPLGRFTEIFGPESSGKTTLCLSICNEAIQSGKKVLYIDAESTLDFAYIRKIVPSFTEDMFNLIQPTTMEDSLRVAEGGIASKDYGLIVVDSLGGLAPQKVMEDDLTDANVALLARLLTAFVQRNSSKIKESNTAFIGVNQVRDRIGIFKGGFETPGGRAWKHLLSLRIQLYKGTQIEIGDDVIGIEVKFTVVKNKVGKPFRSYSIPLIFGVGIDKYRDIVRFSQMLGVLQLARPYYKFEGAVIASGVAKTADTLRNNKEMLDKIVNMCYDTANQKTFDVEEETD